MTDPRTDDTTRPADGPSAGRPAAFFDLDKTLIATSAATVFARPLVAGGVLSRRAALRSAGAQLAFLLGSATEDRTERVREQLSRMAAGWDVGRVQQIVAASLPGSVDRVLFREALDLVAQHHARGEDVVVVSASSEELVRPIAALIGADHVIATRMEVRDGRYTGRLDFYAYGAAKATAMRDLAARAGYDLAASAAYSDSATDAPMLAAVGHASVVNPDRALRALAAEHGWGTVVCRHRSAGAAARAPGRWVAVGAGFALLAIGVAAAIRAARRRAVTSDR
jgi:HAD superfamily hydrolase (TIGR01490 family)